ncbi:MAG TPA: ComEC/Rec2 family competence protein [Magnetospirillaceae bacterium]|nr:ComEC/Rec2 family competence protein [Magnetospirillaceae bacterium]
MQFGGIRYKRVSRIFLLSAGCLSVVCGIGLAAAGWQVSGWLWLILVLGLFLACRQRLVWLALPAAMAAGLVVGMWRGTQQVEALAGYQAYIGQKVIVTGTVSDDSTYDDQQRVMMLENIMIGNDHLPGKVRVKTLSPVAPSRGDVVEVRSKLYGGFGNYQAALYFADVRVTVVAHDPLSALRRTFAAQVRSVLPDTEAGLGLGFLVGIKSALPEDLNDNLKILGLTHIVVASGFNLTVLVRLARRLFAKSSHYQMTMACGVMIIGFVLVAGLSPSMVRAGFVAGLCVIAWYYGRRVHPVLLLSLAAAVTALINPLYVWSDIGWWLSFLAFAGVMLFAPLLQRRIFGEREPRFIGQIIIETLSAQLLTLPLIMMIFNTFSVLSLVANILVVPLVPVGMLLTFVAGVSAAFVPWLAWPATWLLSYLTNLVTWLASVPWASVPIALSLPMFIMAYTILLAVGLHLWYKTHHDYLSKSVIE